MMDFCDKSRRLYISVKCPWVKGMDSLRHRTPLGLGFRQHRVLLDLFAQSCILPDGREGGCWGQPWPRLGHPAPVQGHGWAADRRHAAACWLHVWVLVMCWENVHSCLLQCPFGFPAGLPWGGDGSETMFVLRGSRISATHPGGCCAKVHRPSMHAWTWLAPTHLWTPKLEFHIRFTCHKMLFSLGFFSIVQKYETHS